MSNSKIISAIDVGSTKITTLIAQHFFQEEKTNIIGVCTIPAGGIRRGQIVNIEEATESIIESLEEAERMAGLSINKALIGITAPHISSINSSGVIAVSEPDKEITEIDIERAIESAQAITLPAGMEIIHVTPRQFIVDGQEGIVDPKGMSGIRLEVETNIIIGSSPAIKNLSRCLKEVGIEIQQLIYSGLAAAESVLSETEKELGVILVDIGGTVTSVTVFLESSPCFVRVIPVGSKNITNDIAVGLRLPLEEAEKLKIFLSRKSVSNKNLENKSPRNDRKQDEREEIDKNEIDLFKAGISNQEGKIIARDVAIDGIMKIRIEEIFNLVKDEIKESGFGGATPAGIVITGGGAELSGIEKICQRIIGLPVRIGQPKEMMGLVDEIMSPAYSSSLGLIEYAIKNKIESGQQSYFKNTFSSVKKIKFRVLFQKITEIVKSLLP